MKIIQEKTPTITQLANSDLDNIHHHVGRNKGVIPNVHNKTGFNSQQVLPKLQLNSMRSRVKNQTDIFEDNLKLYQKLKDTKPRIPTKS